MNGQLVENLNYTIINDGDELVWLWFGKDDMSSLNNSQKVRQNFLVCHPQSDGSFYQIMCDGNVGSFTASLFTFLVKVIQPKKDFRISVVYQDTDVSDVAAFIDTHLNMVLEEEIIKQCPGIDQEDVKEQFTYSPSVIAVSWDDFVKAAF